MYKYVLLFLALSFFIACSSEKEEEETEVKQEMTDPHAGVMPGGAHGLNELAGGQSNEDFTNPKVNISGIELTTPDTWEREAPASSMRVLQYALKSDKSLKVTGFFFGEQDLVKENIERWKNEFAKLDKTNEIKLMGDKITMITLEGTYNLKPAPMAQEYTPTADYMVIAAIVPSPEGPYYFKIYGPKATLNKEIESFKKFLNSYKVVA